jgi:hypothetical protein
MLTYEKLKQSPRRLLSLTSLTVADTENIVYPEEMVLHKDSGFQGYEPKVRKLHQPKKSLTRRS